MTDIVQYDPKELKLSNDLTKDDWELIHKNVLVARYAARSWVKQSREYAENKWGAEYVAQCEQQLEMELDLPRLEVKPSINPSDKSGGIITIEGISKSFTMWDRKMVDEFKAWDNVQLNKAIALLEPVERRLQMLKSLLR